MSEEQLKHRRPRLSRVPDAREDLDRPNQGAGEPARPVARLLAGRGLRVHGDPGESGTGGALHRARQSRRRGHQRHGRARAGQHRRARRQAGDGRQGLPVQEVRRHRRVRHRDQRNGSRQDRRRRRRARADVRRHQPRGHQGAGMLLHRTEAARADEDSGFSRRSARDRHRRCGGRAERVEDRRQGHRQGQAGLLGCGRRGTRLPQSAGEPRS